MASVTRLNEKKSSCLRKESKPRCTLSRAHQGRWSNITDKPHHAGRTSKHGTTTGEQDVYPELQAHTTSQYTRTCTREVHSQRLQTTKRHDLLSKFVSGGGHVQGACTCIQWHRIAYVKHMFFSELESMN